MPKVHFHLYDNCAGEKTYNMALGLRNYKY